MKKEYITPELEILTLRLSKDVLSVSVDENELVNQGETEGPGGINDEF